MQINRKNITHIGLASVICLMLSSNFDKFQNKLAAYANFLYIFETVNSNKKQQISPFIYELYYSSNVINIFFYLIEQRA